VSERFGAPPATEADGTQPVDEGPRGRELELPARRVVLLLAILLAVLWLARPIIAPFLVAAAIAYAFTPLVDAVRLRTGLPRTMVAIALYVLGLVGLVALFAVLARRLASELELLVRSGPDALAMLLRQLIGSDRITIGTTEFTVLDLAGQLQDALLGLLASPSGAIHLATQVAEASLQVILTLIVTFYFLIDGLRFRDFAVRFLGPADRARALAVGGRVHAVLARWMRGQLLLVGLVAAVVYVILGPILHVRYALALGLLTGVLEVIPLIGPIAAAAIAGVVAFSTGGQELALTVLVIFFVIRQVEDQVVMPVVIGRAVHLHPVVTIFAVLVGLSAWGILGGLLAVPVAAAVNVTIHELYPEAQGEGANSITEASPPVAGGGPGSLAGAAKAAKAVDPADADRAEQPPMS
jgi:predicted PurR-regulated permease PerM